MPSENAVEARPSSNENNMTEHLVQTPYRLYSIARVSTRKIKTFKSYLLTNASDRQTQETSPA